MGDPVHGPAPSSSRVLQARSRSYRVHSNVHARPSIEDDKILLTRTANLVAPRRDVEDAAARAQRARETPCRPCRTCSSARVGCFAVEPCGAHVRRASCGPVPLRGARGARRGRPTLSGSRRDMAHAIQGGSVAPLVAHQRNLSLSCCVAHHRKCNRCVVVLRRRTSVQRTLWDHRTQFRLGRAAPRLKRSILSRCTDAAPSPAPCAAPLHASCTWRSPLAAARSS